MQPQAHKISYIVHGNPKAVSQLIHRYGYEIPEGREALLHATKALIRRHGKPVITDLLQHHPDRAAIIATQPQPVHDNFCGACQSYSYVPQANSCGTCGHSYYEPTQSQKQYLAQFEEMTTEAVRAYYNDLVEKSKQFPDDPNLSLEVELIFNLLREREKRSEQDTPPEDEGTGKNFMKKVHTAEILAVAGILLVGALLGMAFRTPTKAKCPCSK